MEPQTPPAQPESTPQPQAPNPPAQPITPEQTPAGLNPAVNPQPTQAPATNPQPAPTATSGDPGKTLAIVGLILAFLFPLVGLILGIIARSKSKKAGQSNGLALGAIVVSAINMIFQAIVMISFFSATFSAVQQSARCQEYGIGSHMVDGESFVCTYEDVN